MATLKKILNWDLLKGPALTLACALTLEFMRAGIQLQWRPSAAAVFSGLIVYSVFRGGKHSGYLAAVVAILSVVFFILVGGHVDKDRVDAINRIVSWSFAFPLLAYFVGLWKDNSARVVSGNERAKELTLITDAMPQIVFTMDAAGKLTYLNKMWTEYSGVDFLAAQARGWGSFILPEDLAGTQQAWRSAMETKSVFSSECRLQRAGDESYRWHLVRALPIYNEAGQLEQWVGSSTDIHDSRVANAELFASRERVALVAGKVDAFLFAINREGIFTFAEGKAHREQGASGHTRVGNSIYKDYPDATGFINAFRTALGGAESKSILQVSDRWIENHLSPSYNSAGEVIGVVGVGMDVTTRFNIEITETQQKLKLESENALRASEAKYKAAFEISPIGIGLCNLEGKWLEVSPSFCKMVGYSKEELLQMTNVEMTPPEDPPTGMELRQRVKDGEFPSVTFNKRYLHKNGSYVYVSIMGSYIRAANGQPDAFLTQIIDVSDRRRAEILLRETTRRMQTILDASPAAIVALDKDGNVNLWNPACERMFGWTDQEVLGKPLPFIPGDKVAEAQQRFTEIRATTDPHFFEAERIRKDGTSIHVRIGGMPLREYSGEQDGMMAVMTDITQLRQHEKDLRSANRELVAANEAKSGFLANISHEIRTPINGVLGMTALLSETPLNNDQRVYTDTIRSSAEILLSLINDVLDFSKIEAGHVELENIAFETSHLADNIRRILDETALAKGLTLKQFVDPNLKDLELMGDPTKVGQVLANLVNNALKFTPQGEVTVNVLHTGRKDGKVGVRFEVKDTGIGIAPAAMDRMFRPFSQADASTSRRYGGTGLGLSICKHLVEAMGGQIGVTSEEGQGSTFWFELKFLRGSHAKSIAESTSTQALVPLDFKSVRVLLVEDNSVNKLIAVKMLEARGFNVSAVGNGREAVEAIQLVPYNLILMDCQMPVMDGYEATRQIRALSGVQSQVPIVALTANALMGDREKCLAAGMDDYVSKPIRAAELMTTIERVLRAQSGVAA